MGRDGHSMERECLVKHADVDKQSVYIFSGLETYEQQKENLLNGVGHHLKCQFSVTISFSPIFSNSWSYIFQDSQFINAPALSGYGTKPLFLWVLTNNFSTSLLFQGTESCLRLARECGKCLTILSHFLTTQGGHQSQSGDEQTEVKGRTTLPKATQLGNGLIMILLQTWCYSYDAGAELVVNQAGSLLSLWFLAGVKMWKESLY